MEKKRIRLKDALETNEGFLAFLKQEANSDEYRELRRRAEQGSHPSEEMLHDYVTDCLSDEEARFLRDHISFCGECAKETLRIRMVEERLERDLVDRFNTPPFLERLKNFFLSPGRALVSAAGVATTCLILSLFYPPSLDRRINDAYQIAIVQHVNSTLPWKKSGPGLGFASPKGDSPWSRAFGAGVWSGSQALASKSSEDSEMPAHLSPKWEGDRVSADAWSDTSWDTYYHMGRWCFLMQTVCLSGKELPYKFWEKQGIILGKIQEKFDDMPEANKAKAKAIRISLGRVESVLKDLDGNPPARKDRREIASQTGHLIRHLSP